MTRDKIDFTSILAGMSPEKRNELLQPMNCLDEAKRKLLKENPNLFNYGSFTANALARDCIRRENKRIIF